jgi:hypothetical protein
MTPDAVSSLDYWGACLATFPPVAEDLARLVRRYQEALLTL